MVPPMPHRPSQPSERPSRASSRASSGGAPGAPRPPRPPRSPLEELTVGLKAGGARAWLALTGALPPSTSLLWPLWGVMAALSLLALASPSWVLLSPTALSAGRVWTLITAPLATPPTSPLPLLLLGGVWVYSVSGLAQGGALRREPLYTALAVTLSLLTLGLFLGGVAFSLTLSALTLIWFARPIERDPRRGPQGLLRLLLITLAAAGVGGALWVVTVGGTLHGDTALQRGLITAWGMSLGRRRLPWLNIAARDLRWVTLAFCALELLLSPSPTAASALAATLAVWMYFDYLEPRLSPRLSPRL
jgi:hypothetical protein